MDYQSKQCKYCGADIDKSAKACPFCGEIEKKPITKKWWFWTIIVIVVIGAIGSMNLEKSNNTISINTSSLVSQAAPINSSEQSKAPATTEKPVKPSVEAASPKDNVPAEYKSALKKANSYASIMNMSKIGVYNQLTSEYGEKFSPEAAQYAMDNIKADWKANALAKSISYSDMMHMSKVGIFEQLISEYGEKFTEEEAQYAIDNIKADWKANALAKAKSYQEIMAMSPAGIRDQLVSDYGEKFTAEEADYAIQHLND